MKKKREENVELADIQAVRERMTQWAIRLWLLLIPVIVGIILSTQGESTARAGNFIVRIAFLLILMGAGYVAYLRNLERKYWAKYQQIHRMDNLLRANLVGVWLCAEARVAVYREGSGYRVQLGVLDEKTGAWENDEQDEVFPTLADVREYATQEGYEPMDVDFGQMTDEEFQQFLDRSRI